MKELILLLLEATPLYHGYKRLTGDVDIWLKPDNENKERFIPVLSEFELEEEALKEIKLLDFTKHLVISIWEEPEKVDFLTRINLVKYDEADSQKIFVETNGLKIPFLHLDDLVLSKMNTGRLKDKADIEELQKIQKIKSKMYPS